MDLMSALDNEFQECGQLYQGGFYRECTENLHKMDYNKLGINEKFQYNVLIGMIYYSLGDYHTSEKWLNKPTPSIQNLKTQYLTVRCSIYKVMCWLRSSKVDESMTSLNTLLPEVLSQKFVDLEALIYNWLGNSFWFKGNLKEALNYHEMSLKLIRTIDPQSTAKSLNNIGIIYRVQGRLKKAIEIFNEGILLNVNNTRITSFLYLNRSLAYFELEEFNLALEDQEKALALRLKSGSDFLVADSLFNMIRIADSLHDEKLVHENSAKLEKLPDFPGIPSLKLMAKVYSQKGENPSKLLSYWKGALGYESLEFSYKILCNEEIIMIQINQNINHIDDILANINEFEALAENNKLYPSLAKIRIIKGIIYKNLFEIQNAKDSFEDAIVISSDFGLPYHEKLARQELLNLSENMNKFDNFYKMEEHEPEVKGEDILSYIKNFKVVLEEFSN